MSWGMRAALSTVLVVTLLFAHHYLVDWHQLLTLPDSINITAAVVVGLIFSASLLRLGPRKFLSRLLIKFNSNSHDHSHKDGHEHNHGHHH
jgi:hypothetical protein